LASRPGAALPSDAAAADAFLAGISMASLMVPELRDHTPLRRRWQEFCLELGRKGHSESSDQESGTHLTAAVDADPSRTKSGR
jgi:hypothetical protein